VRLAVISVIGLVSSALTACTWAMLAPIEPRSSKKVFEIPRGTWAGRMRGEDLAILPDEIHLTLGIEDILLLRNLDEVPQIFGPTLMMPGQSLQLPFAVASEYVFACTAHASGQMIVAVEPFPATPLARLAWRIRQLFSGG
jgi:hypothetical protein